MSKLIVMIEPDTQRVPHPELGEHSVISDLGKGQVTLMAKKLIAEGLSPQIIICGGTGVPLDASQTIADVLKANGEQATVASYIELAIGGAMTYYRDGIDLIEFVARESETALVMLDRQAANRMFPSEGIAMYKPAKCLIFERPIQPEKKGCQPSVTDLRAVYREFGPKLFGSRPSIPPASCNRPLKEIEVSSAELAL